MRAEYMEKVCGIQEDLRLVTQAVAALVADELRAFRDDMSEQDKLRLSEALVLMQQAQLKLDL